MKSLIVFLLLLCSVGVRAQTASTTTATQLTLLGNKTDFGNEAFLYQQSNSIGGLTYALPATAGSNGYALTTNGSGVLSWTSISGIAGLTTNGFTYATSATTVGSTVAPTNGQLLIGSTGAAPVLAALTGTSNEITVTNAAGSITLATPQAIATGSSPTFAALTLTAPLSVPNGGTGLATLTANALQVGNGTSTPTQLGVGGATTVLIGGASPAYQALSIGSTLTGNAVTTSLGIDLTHANTWTGAQTLGNLNAARITESALASNTNNYAVTSGYTYHEISASSAVNVTGIVAGTDGQVLILSNAGTNAITLQNANASSTAVNRFLFGSDVILGPDPAVIMLVYDGHTDSRWKLVNH